MVTIIDTRAVTPAAVWKHTYYNSETGSWSHEYGGTLYEQLLLLPATASRDDVRRITRGLSWPPMIHCDSCGEEDYRCGVALGEKNNDESRTVYLCPSCFEEAVSVVRNAGICTGI